MQIAGGGEVRPKRRYRDGPGRKPHLSLVMMLPTPPQLEAERGEWLATVGHTIRLARFGCVPGGVRVLIRAPLSGSTKELKALAAPIVTALAKFGVMEREDCATAIITEWATDIPAGVVAVTVKQLSSPETRHRIQLAQRRMRDARVGA